MVYETRESDQSHAKEVAIVPVSDPSLLAPIGTFVAEITEEAIARAVKMETSAVSPYQISSES